MIPILTLAAAFVLPTHVTPAHAVRVTPPHAQTRAPLLVVQPVVVYASESRNRVWVPGHYVTQVLRNGTSVMVWIPGYFR